jgi:hypothetical protein
MEDGVIIDSEGFSRDVARFALLSGRSMAEELKNQAKGVMRNIVRVTPPFNGSGGVSAARAQGENAIRHDLQRIFRPVRLVGSRKITHLFGKAHPNAPWIVATKEQHPDVEGIYRNHKAEPDRFVRQARYRNARFVDEGKYHALEAKLKKRVGYLGGGFAPAASGLGVALPSFMRRHAASAPGRIQMQLEGDSLSIVITNEVRYGTKVIGFVRRVEFAIEMQRGKMERQIPFLLRRHEHLIN